VDPFDAKSWSARMEGVLSLGSLLLVYLQELHDILWRTCAVEKYGMEKLLRLVKSRSSIVHYLEKEWKP
jgi:hypothetical protein